MGRIVLPFHRRSHMKKLFFISAFALLPLSASAQDAASPESRIEGLTQSVAYCSSLSQVITTQRNAAEDQLASAAANINVLTKELNATKAALAEAKKKISEQADQSQNSK